MSCAMEQLGSAGGISTALGSLTILVCPTCLLCDRRSTLPAISRYCLSNWLLAFVTQQERNTDSKSRSVCHGTHDHKV